MQPATCGSLRSFQTRAGSLSLPKLKHSYSLNVIVHEQGYKVPDQAPIFVNQARSDLRKIDAK